jgi:predicted RNA polymerase sigma factor
VVRQHAGQLAAALMRVTGDFATAEDLVLLHLSPSPVGRLHRAIAVRYATGARGAMAELDDLAESLGEYHLYHATRAELLREMGDPDQARAADRRALDLTSNPAEQAVLRQRLTWT